MEEEAQADEATAAATETGAAISSSGSGGLLKQMAASYSAALSSVATEWATKAQPAESSDEDEADDRGCAASSSHRFTFH